MHYLFSMGNDTNSSELTSRINDEILHVKVKNWTKVVLAPENESNNNSQNHASSELGATVHYPQDDERINEDSPGQNNSFQLYDKS